jgi:hypothetical protein
MNDSGKSGANGPLRIGLEEALARLPGPDGKRFASVLDEGVDLEVEVVWVMFYGPEK